jgi:hypothetical protein
VLRIHKSALERDFTMLPNGAIRDQRLSALARCVLADLLSRPVDWQTNADRMWAEARRHRGDRAEGRRAFREAWTELEEYGYMRRAKRREGSKWITIIDVYDTPQAFGGTGSGTSEVGTSESGTSLRSNEDEVLMMNTDETRGHHEPQNDAGTERPSHRTNDRELFFDLLGGSRVESEGIRWRPGTYTAEALYKGYMKTRKITWPGSYLATIDEEGGGLEYWLLEEGITVLDDDPWAAAA